MELFCIVLFSTWPSFILYSNQLTYIEYEASNIYTASAFQTKSVYSVGEPYFHILFHYISAWAETSLYQFRRVGLSASWSVGELVVGELDCWGVGLSASWIVGELVCRRVGCRQVGLSATELEATGSKDVPACASCSCPHLEMSNIAT